MAVKKAKPAPKKPLVKKAEPAKKPAKKVEKKKVEKKKPEKKAPKKVEKKKVEKKVLKEPAEKEYARTYHVVKRKEDGKWEVKFAYGQKAIKLFATQKEALEYSKKMAKNQGGSLLVHNSKGANKGRIKKK